MTIWKPGSSGSQLEVGDDDGDLDEFVDREVEPRHLAVDPHETIVVGSPHHALHPSQAASDTGLRRGTGSEPPREDSNSRPSRVETGRSVP